MSDFTFVICADCGYTNAVKSGDRIRCRDCDSVWEGRTRTVKRGVELGRDPVRRQLPVVKKKRKVKTKKKPVVPVVAVGDEQGQLFG